MSNATDVINMLIAGPTRIPDIPVPQGCEHVPAVGTGMGMQEMIKTTAAMSPTRGLNDRSIDDFFLSSYNPHATNGIAIANHNTAQLNGNIPSEMCMAWASETMQSSRATEQQSKSPINFLESKP